MNEKEQFDNAMLVIRDYLEDFSNRDKRLSARKAIKDIRNIYRGEKEENTYLKGWTEDTDFKGLISMSEQTIDSVQAGIDPPKREECDINLKVRFLLKKCKELYETIQEYDTPTDNLIESVNVARSQVSKAFRPYQDFARRVFQDGVIEDISNMMIKLTEKPSKLKIQDPKYALAHYVLKKNILRQKEKLRSENESLFKIEKEHSFGKKTLKKVGTHFTELPVQESVKEGCQASITSDEKENYFYEEILDEEKVPRKVLSELYSTYPSNVADKTMYLITRKSAIPLRSSTTNLVAKVSMGEADLDLDFSYYDWTESLKSKEEFYKRICKESVQEKETSSPLKAFTTRLKGRTFPNLKPDQLSIAKFKSRKIISSPIIRKFHITGKAPTFYSRIPSNHTKILQSAKVEPTAKALLRQRFEKSTDINCSTHSNALDERIKTQDAVVKSYISKLKRSRIEKLERLEHLNEHDYSKGFQKGICGSAKITIPFLNSNIIQERLLLNHEPQV